MNSAIESVVAAYVQTGQLDVLLDLKAHRERLMATVRDRADFNFGVLLGQLEEDIGAIEGGIRRLRAAAEARTDTDR
ncbi:hypothetical protein RPMA_08055 [Tardiphaga alba]|uniref:Uncharacterized protein n=1 Tax=Tardiphaga alba TaxID=340268 RepID=A0ABX8A509_9BRAD|nr:hypothetical protein [Tardiphaga alba]QUS38789.1 hypothetical protein RPMA_08055 [Tardiphaga alba]